MGVGSLALKFAVALLKRPLVAGTGAVIADEVLTEGAGRSKIYDWSAEKLKEKAGLPELPDSKEIGEFLDNYWGGVIGALIGIGLVSRESWIGTACLAAGVGVLAWAWQKGHVSKFFNTLSNPGAADYSPVPTNLTVSTSGQPSGTASNENKSSPNTNEFLRITGDSKGSMPQAKRETMPMQDKNLPIPGLE